MSDGVYRVVTICPEGMSDALKAFLAMPATDDVTSNMKMRDLIALNLISPYKKSTLPFCCTFLGWISSAYPADTLEYCLSNLNNIKISTGSELISTEGVSHKLDNGIIYLVGAYPLLDMPEPIRSSEYNNISFLVNKKTTQNLFDWCYRTFLRGVLNTDKYGIVIAVQANYEFMADHKIHEAVALLGIK